MKNEMFDLSEKNLKNWIGRVYAGYSKQSHPIDRFRHLGGLEILLALAGKLNLDGKIEYKEIEVPKYFLGFEQTKAPDRPAPAGDHRSRRRAALRLWRSPRREGKCR